jgi:transposase
MGRSADWLEASSVPKYLTARAPHDDGEARKIRRLAGARHAPADWIERARIIALSWDGLGVPAIAAQIGRHENTVRRWLHRFNAAGIEGLGNQPGAGRKRRITETERSRIIALARSVPPGRLDRDAAGELSADDERGPAQWTLDTLSRAARDAGIQAGRSQVRRILLAEKVRWRRTRSWAASTDPEFAPKGPRSWNFTPPRRRAPPSSAPTSSAR